MAAHYCRGSAACASSCGIYWPTYFYPSNIKSSLERVRHEQPISCKKASTIVRDDEQTTVQSLYVWQDQFDSSLPVVLCAQLPQNIKRMQMKNWATSCSNRARFLGQAVCIVIDHWMAICTHLKGVTDEAVRLWLLSFRHQSCVKTEDHALKHQLKH